MCKGGKNSVVLVNTMKDMLDDYIDKGNDEKLRPLVATIMNNVS